MTDLTILSEETGDAEAIQRLTERTFGPGRYALTAYRIREGVGHDLALSFTGRIGSLLVGSVRQTPVRVGDATGLMLGPLTVEPPFRGRGIGRALIERALAEASRSERRLVFLVGDEPYYSRFGFRGIRKGQVTMPGPVDPDRLLVRELVAGAFEGVTGEIRPDYDALSPTI